MINIKKRYETVTVLLLYCTGNFISIWAIIHMTDEEMKTMSELMEKDVQTVESTAAVENQEKKPSGWKAMPRKRRRRIIRLVVLLLVLAAAGFAIWKFTGKEMPMIPIYEKKHNPFHSY